MKTPRCGSITPRQCSHCATSQPGNPTHKVHALCDFRVLRQSAAKPGVEPYPGSAESTEVQFPLL
jgi:hypothetical protein